jgi:hypothetical protein
MARTSKTKTETFITYVVVKAHDGLQKGEEKVRKVGDKGAEYCVSLGLWKEKKSTNKE